MLVAAGLEHKTPAEIADAYEAAFHADAALVNILPAHVFPRATEHIAEMIALAERLVDAGHAYVSDGGQRLLRGRHVPGLRRAVRATRLDELRAGHRGEVEPRQARPGRLRAVEGRRRGTAAEVADPALGRGLPGLAPRVLGDGDALPRARGSTSTPAAWTTSSPTTRTRSPSRRRSSADRRPGIWVHGEFLLVAGRKMAKSAGNIERITDAGRRGIDPLAFRYLALTSRYRHKLEYSDESSRPRPPGSRRCARGCAALGPPPDDGPWAAPPALVGPGPPAIARPGSRRASPATATAPGPCPPTDRAHAPAAPLSAPGRDAPRPVRRRDRRRPGPAGGAGGRPRDRSAPTSPPTSGAGSCSTPTRARAGPRPAVGTGRPRPAVPDAGRRPGVAERAAARAARRLRAGGRLRDEIGGLGSRS